MESEDSPLTPEEYRKAEGFGESSPETIKIKKPKQRTKKHFRISTPGERVQNLLYFSTIFLLSIVTITSIESDEIKNNINQSPDNQFFGLPHSKKEAVEVTVNNKSSRQFAATNPGVDNIICAESFIRKGDIHYDKNVLPVVRTEIDFPKDRVLFAKESVFSSTVFNKLVTCSYPESDPSEIIHIPIRRAGE